jgi:hypothetical protein
MYRNFRIGLGLLVCYWILKLTWLPLSYRILFALVAAVRIRHHLN